MSPLQSRPLEFGEGWSTSDTGLLVPPMQRRRYDRPVGLDLFAGAGGFSLGFHQAGWHVAAACEWDAAAAVTYLANLARPGVKIHFLDGQEGEERFTRELRKCWGLKVPREKDRAPLEFSDEDLDHLAKCPPSLAGSGWISNQPATEPACEHFYFGDIRKLNGERVLADLDLEVGQLDAVFGGPPCQGFSRAGKRNIMDPRNSLVFEFTRLVRETQPKAFVMENVPGMANMVTEDGIPVVDAICLDLERGGYGTLGALKNMLEASSGVGAAVKPGERMKGGAKADDDEEAEGAAEADQLAMELA